MAVDVMGDKELKEVYLSGETLYQGKIITVEKWQVSTPSGREATREVVRHLGAAAVVPVDERGFITLVRQHRVAVDRFTWEIPAGKLDFVGEDPLHCAKRELEEETGLRANNWQKLTQVIPTPGYCTEQISLYLATGLSQHSAHTDPDEFIRLTRMPLDEALGRVMAGEFEDAKTCLGILMAHKALAARDRPRYGDGLPPFRRTARGGPLAEGQG